MSEPSFVVTQDIYKASYPPISVTPCRLECLTRNVIDDFLVSVDGDTIGLAPGYGTHSVFSAIAFASSSQVLLVQLPKDKGKAKRRGGSGRGKDLLQSLLISASTKLAFQMDILATSLYSDLNIRICSAVDLLSISNSSRESFQALTDAMGGASFLNKQNVSALFDGGEDLRKTTNKQIALQAWTAWRAANLVHMTERVNHIPRIDTKSLDASRLAVFAKLARDLRCLLALKPTSVHNEIVKDPSIDKDELTVTCARFKTRVQARDVRTIKVQVLLHGQQISFAHCRSPRVNGRMVRLKLDKPLKLPKGCIVRLTTFGKESLTGSEQERIDIVLRALQKLFSIASVPFFQAIWLPQEKPVWRTSTPSSKRIPIQFPRPLNSSQENAVHAIMSSNRIDVIHGPPGTGKTTVIAAAVMNLSRCSTDDTSMWLVAQSNVAVKNIAEKLASVGFLDFKVVVSKGRHEHLYEKINPNLIRSDKLAKDIVGVDRQLLDSRVILCTLSMLSNPCLSNVTRLVPVRTVIVDEASQVEVGDFLPMLSLFSKTLQKLVFIGDDKQLAPYGQGDVPALQSVFEMEHLRKGAVFLDTQCIMPMRLGNFISKHVYDNKLQSKHPHTSPCCRFIDVKKGKETQSGSSWINEAEIRAAISEAKKCVAKHRSYRIITPYDAQRARLEKALESAGIPWEDRVFCVDSFQGNESDYIILSLVKTQKIGFLNEKRRVNVMLTRCKKGMTILTNRGFVEGAAKDTLVGLLAKDVGPDAWEEV
ncbi:regulator of nonsense transcripts 1 [Favolaschia claudopus]|uniref:Regulator of nonsense transcripts 1 n=1 Tax=Favolaschia claudopus TaxID=2862362 RepID=A0AAW0C1A5_9AGAR